MSCGDADLLLVQPTFDDVARAVQQLQQRLPARLAGPARDTVEVALSEVLTNIVRHGFQDVAPSAIEVRCSERADALVVEVSDRGTAIPPGTLAAAASAFDFDPEALELLPEGGMGLAIIQAAFDVVEYRSAGGTNCMHLEKKFA